MTAVLTPYRVDRCRCCASQLAPGNVFKLQQELLSKIDPGEIATEILTGRRSQITNLF